MAKCRIGHFVEAQVLEALEVDFIDESEVLTPADEAHHIDKQAFTVPFVCGATDLGEALRRISEGAAMIRTKGEAGTGNVVEAVRHMRAIRGGIAALAGRPREELHSAAKDLRAPYELVAAVADDGRLPVVNFAAGGIATPADAALMMQLGAEGVFVGSGIFKSADPPRRARAIVEAVTHHPRPRRWWRRPRAASGDAMPGLEILGDRRGRAAKAAPGGEGPVPSLGRPRSACWRCRGRTRSTPRPWRRPAPTRSRCASPGTSRGSTGSCCPAGRARRSGWSRRAPGSWRRCARRDRRGLPALGTCAGMIVLARATTGGAQPLVGGMDIVVRRNAFGRQVASFEAIVDVPPSAQPVDAVFIRAPWIEEAGPGVEVPRPPLRPRRRRAPGRPAGDRVPPGAVRGAALSRVAGGAREVPPRRRGRAGRRREEGPCPGTVSGRRSSARRARPTPSAASSSRSSRGRSSWRRRRWARPGVQRGPRDRHPEGARQLDAEGQHRAGDPARRRGGRGGRVRVDGLRGLRPGRRGRHRDDPHRQPQPHGERRTSHLH